MAVTSLHSSFEIRQIIGEAAWKFASLVHDQKLAIIDKFQLECGVELKNLSVAYKSWGELNESGANVIVVCHALSGSADVEDWWAPLIGPGKAFDPTRFFIICMNVLGSPYGSSSPLTLNPETGKPYGPEFPLVTVRDDVRIHKILLDSLGVTSVEFVIGGSMGGMQALEWAYLGTQCVKNVVCIATSARHSAWCISWGEAQRQSIYSDPRYADGYYSIDNPPSNGLSAARMCALLTYRSQHSFQTRFDRKIMPARSKESHDISPSKKLAMYHNEGNKMPILTSQLDSTTNSTSDLTRNTSNQPIYTAQSYLRYQADKFIHRFDANCYISITRKLDTHDISRDRGTLYESLTLLEQPMMVIGIETDGLFTIGEQEEIAQTAPNAEFHVIHSTEGHDGFLLEFEKINELIMNFEEKHSSMTINERVQVAVKEIKNSVFGEAEDLLIW